MDDFNGRTAIITGGASGIGRALAEELCRPGALITLADRNAALLEETVAARAAKSA
ncbi:MAG: SDR family NAD(P)-dependent oxidoreductase [Actinomycetota bacterium]|nr:SDR family NAD(P)-dependent oxidoreductase [Actinomycetota bacterium]